MSLSLLPGRSFGVMGVVVLTSSANREGIFSTVYLDAAFKFPEVTRDVSMVAVGVTASSVLTTNCILGVVVTTDSRALEQK